MTTTLQDRLRKIHSLFEEIRSAGLDVPIEIRECHHIDVAVVGELKRGKSTFLNALLRAKVFPSRALVCTSAVTVLVDDPVPSLTVRYLPNTKHKKEEHFSIPPTSTIFDTMMSLVAKQIKKKDGMLQGNPSAAEIDEVEVRFPNSYAIEGVRLVDTPGVNDPDTWREEITYRYLGRADAAIMLLDPHMPLSQSEIEFLRDKVQTRVKHNLIFVLNKADQVTDTDLESSMKRIRGILEKYVPNPQLYPLASKPAMEAMLAGQPPDSRFVAFSEALDAFLRRGRAGALLVSRVSRLLDAIVREDASLKARLDTLEQDDHAAKADLDILERRLKEERHVLQNFDREMSAWLNGQHRSVTETLIQQLSQWRQAIDDNPDGVRSAINQLRRDLVTHIEESISQLSAELVRNFSEEAQLHANTISGIKLEGRDLDIGNFRFGSSQNTQDDDAKKGGAYLGMALGGAVGGIPGAIIGGIIGWIVGENITEQNKNLDTSRLKSALQEHFTQLEKAAKARVSELICSVEEQIKPVLREPWEQSIKDSENRVAESRSDLKHSSEHRESQRNELRAKRKHLAYLRGRCSLLQEELTHA